jgi:hypothetical protein
MLNSFGLPTFSEYFHLPQNYQQCKKKAWDIRRFRRTLASAGIQFKEISPYKGVLN